MFSVAHLILGDIHTIEDIDERAKLMEDNPWIDFIDCWQVGFNSHGELVAYDYAG